MAAGMAVGAAMGMIGSLMQGQAQASALERQADLNIQNAAEAKAQGAFNANRSQMTAGKRIGDIMAGYGASGVTATSGSVQEILRSSTANAEMDRLNILHGADLKAIQYENQASMERAGAGSARSGSIFGALGTAASTAGRMKAVQSGNTTAPAETESLVN